MPAVDLSSEAVQRCRERHAGIAGLEFRVMDVCEPTPAPRKFDLISDSGCFHVIPPRLHPAYARNPAHWAAAGTKLLILALRRHESFEELAAGVQGLPAGGFTLVHSALTVMRRYGPETDPDTGSRETAGPPAGEFRFIRRATT